MNDMVNVLILSPYLLVAAVVWAALEQLKKWKRFADWAKMGSPVARSLWALLLAALGSIGLAASAWGRGESFLVGAEIFGASTAITWLFSMGGNSLIGAIFNKPADPGSASKSGPPEESPPPDVEVPPTTVERAGSYRKAALTILETIDPRPRAVWSFSWVRLPVLAVVVVLGMWGLGQMACTPSALQIQARAADALGRTVNAATSIFHDMEKKEGSAAIKKATTRDEAEAGLQKVELKWKPLWDAVDSFAAAQDAWISSMQKGKPLPDQLLTAVCDLKFIASKVAPSVELPSIPGFVCPEAE